MNMTAFTQLFAAKSPFIIVPAIFVIIGLSYTSYALFRFLTANDLPSHNAKPKYDHVYFGLQLMSAVGWTGFVTIFFINILFAAENDIDSPYLILLCWAIMALGFGLLFVLRLEMIIAATNYKASHASFPWRYFYRLQAKRLGSESPWRKKLQRFVAAIFAVIGALILGYFVISYPRSAQEIKAEISAITTNIQTSQIFAAEK